MENLNETKIPESKEAPKAKTRAEKVADKFAEFKNAKSLMTNAKFNNLATDVLNEEFALTLADGENPSAKYLKQKIEARELPAQISKFLNDLITFVEYVEAGQGVEYILTEEGTVNSMDPTAFVPSEVYAMGDHTYIDTITLPEIGSNKTKAMERSAQLYKYIQYYLSGKAEEVKNIIVGKMDISMNLSIFEDLLAILERMYAVISAKTSGENVNYLEGTADNAIDAMKEFRDFITPMFSYNTRFNWGIDDGSQHADFNDATNFAHEANLKFITDYRTYNNIKKILPTIFHDDKLSQSLLGDTNNWLIVPTSYLSVSKPDSTTINEQPTLVQNYSLFTKTEGEKTTRQAGTIMVIQANDIKAAYNFDQNESQYYPKNCVTQVFKKKNITLKALKWAQVGVFKNEHLEDAFAIPTKTVA